MTQEQREKADKLETMRADLWTLLESITKGGYKLSNAEKHILENIAGLVAACQK